MPQETMSFDSLYDILMGGGPLMIPIAICSVIALAYMCERSIRLRAARLSSKRFEDELASAVRAGGASAGVQLCEAKSTSQAKVLAVGMRYADWPYLEREKAVEDAGSREVQRLSANLKPLVVIGMIAPLLGLLGTVWGMIEAFASIALESGLGSPETLASGISQALVTTAAGLCVAIPSQAAYYFFKSKIDRFVRQTEDAYAQTAPLLGAPVASESVAA